MAGTDIPAGAGDRATPAGDQQENARAAWRAASAAHAARIRRGITRRRTGGYRAGMARRPPPPPGGDAAA